MTPQWTRNTRASQLPVYQRLLSATLFNPIDLQYAEDPAMNYATTAPLTKGWMPEGIHPVGQQSSFV